MLRRLLGAAVFAAVMVSPARARAQDAQSLFDQGLEEMKGGRYKLGCALIKQSLDVDARPGTLFTLAECYSRAGKYASAVADYDRFLALFENMTPEQQEQQRERAEVSRAARTRLVTSVAWLTVSLPPYSPSNVTITLDGEEFASSLVGIATAIDPGPHVFTLHAPDGPLVEQRIDISPGERKRVLLEVQSPETEGTQQEAPPPTADQGAPEPHQKRSLNKWVFVTGGLGAAGLVTGAVTGALLLGKRSTIKSDCPGPANADGKIVCRSDAGKAAADTAQNTLAPITTVALAVGVAGVISTVVLLAVDGQDSTGAPPPVTARLGFTPVFAFSSRGADVGFEKRW